LRLLFILAPGKSRIARLAGRVLRVIILLRWLSSVALAALTSCARISHWQGTTIGRAADESNREPLHHPTELTWRGAGFSPADALLWDAAAFDPAGADLWRRHEFDVNDAYAWRKIIVELCLTNDEISLAATLRTMGWTPQSLGRGNDV